MLVTLKKVKLAYNGTGGVIQLFVSAEPGTIATPYKFLILFEAHQLITHLAYFIVYRVREYHEATGEENSQH